MTLAFPGNVWYHSIAPAGVMELVDVTDSKSVGLIPRVGSSPTTGTNKNRQVSTERNLSIFA